VILAHAHVSAGIVKSTSLSDENITGFANLAAKNLDS
jgi:hypothetical protein